VGLTATEHLSRPYEVFLELRPGKPSAFDLDEFASLVLNKSLAVSIAPSEQASDVERYFHGEVAGIVLTDSADDRTVPHVVLELRPSLWRLARTADTRYFTGKSSQEIVSLILDEHGLAGQYEWHANPGIAPRIREHCWQYRETNLQFVQRLLEEDGYQYWFKFEQTSHKLHIGSRPEPLPNVTPHPLKMGPIGPDAEGTGRIGYLRRQYSVAPSEYVVSARTRDGLDPLTSAASVERAGASGKLYDHDGLAESISDCKQQAQRRLDSQVAGTQVADGHSDFRQLAAGCTFEIEGPNLLRKAGKYRVTAIRHEATQSTGIYSNRFEAVPSRAPFAQRRRTAKPAIPGHLSATVVEGPDTAGRYRLQFDQDRTGTPSGWVPLARGTDALFLPRKSHRVEVSFLEGDLDRPLIERLVDPDACWPFSPADNPNLGGFVTPKHEILLQSDPEKPWIKILSAGDIDDIAEGDRYIDTRKSRQEKTAGDAIWQIDADGHFNIGGNLALQAAKEFGLQANDIVINATGSIVLRVGSSFISINASEIIISGPLVNINPPGASNSKPALNPRKPDQHERSTAKPKSTQDSQQE
jgi:type VI secretion system secreted protein VgrG